MGCSCHINPPCSYCTDRCECAKCGELNITDDMVYLNGEFYCEECNISADKYDNISLKDLYKELKVNKNDK